MRSKKEDFIGWTSPDGNLEVIGIAGKGKDGKTSYKITCKVCSEDKELFPDGYFIANKNNITNNGQLPCGCSKSPRWNKEQYIILLKRKLSPQNISFKLSDEYNNRKTDVDCICNTCKTSFTKTIYTLLNKTASCETCNKKDTSTELAIKQKVFGKLTVMGYAEEKDKRFVSCLCSCGKKKDIRASSLLDGCSTSCGCGAILKVREKNNATRNYSSNCTDNKFYHILQDMYRRCYSKNRKDYKHYGGRGITICDRWKKTTKYYMDNFIEDMGESYIDGYEIDRIDVNGNYCKENCRWVDRKTQTNNTRSNRTLTWNNLEFTSSEIAYLIGVDMEWISDRINFLKYSTKVEDMLKVKFKDRAYSLLYKGKIMSAKKVFELNNYLQYYHTYRAKYETSALAAEILFGAKLIKEREKVYTEDFNEAYILLKNKEIKTGFDYHLINKIEEYLNGQI